MISYAYCRALKDIWRNPLNNAHFHLEERIPKVTERVPILIRPIQMFKPGDIKKVDRQEPDPDNEVIHVVPSEPQRKNQKHPTDVIFYINFFFHLTTFKNFIFDTHQTRLGRFGVVIPVKITNERELKPLLKQCSAILFDLDGTLFDLHADWFAIKQFILSHYTKTYQDTINPQLPFREIFQTIEDRQNREATQFYLNYMAEQELISIKEHKYTPLWLINQGLDKIAELVRFDCFFGIISNNFHDSILEILNMYGLNDRFRVVIGRDDVERPKPNPEGIIRVMDGYDLFPEKVLFTGDLSTDEEVAQKAHVHFLFPTNVMIFLEK